MNPTMPRRRGIDGLRAIAVAAVLLYHAGMGWLPGGYLGVDVFFAISGYLITSLLVAEHSATGTVSLPHFWLRRARRLLPAVFALLVGVTIVAIIGAHDAVGRLRGDVVAAMAYVSNWWQIVRGETYFESFGRPPLLRHLWSLAVEEQLYLVLPVVVLLFGRNRKRLAVAMGAAAVGSLVLLHALWRDPDPSRAWFGTDTRAAPLLLGVAVGLLLPMADRRRLTARGRTVLDVVAVAAIAGLVVLMATVGDRSLFLPRWGFGLTAVLSVLAIVCITGPASRVGHVLGMRPLVWLGTRSYAVYLWHWPVIVLTRPGVDMHVDGWRLFTFRCVIIGVLAELSWRFVEQPVRTGAFVRGWFDLSLGVRRRVAAAGTAATIVLATALAVGLTAASTTSTPSLLATAAASPTTATTLARIPSTTISSITTTTTSRPATSPPATGATTTAVPPALAPPPGSVLAIGDSVMLAARDALVQASEGHIYVDAAIGRQVGDGLDVLQRYKDNGTLAGVSAVVIHLGTNGKMSDELFHRLADIVDGVVPRVVVLNVRVPKSWEEASNAAIDGGVPQHSEMRLADWHTASGNDGVLEHDGVHPTPKGAHVYAYIVLGGLQDEPPPSTTTTTTTAPPPPSSTTTTTAPPASTTTTTTPPVTPSLPSQP